MTKNISVNDFFETADLHLGSVLLTLGFNLDYIDKHDPSKARFIFLREEGLDEAVQSFWARTLKLDPLSVLTNLKILKNRLYSNEP